MIRDFDLVGELLKRKDLRKGYSTDESIYLIKSVEDDYLESGLDVEGRIKFYKSRLEQIRKGE
jgi:hypothetical protein